MSQDTNVNNLIINKLTKQQYAGIANPDPTQLYFVTDEGEKISTLDDVTLTNLANGEVLVYDSLSQKWVNKILDSLPSQTGNSGKFLTTDGTSASWDTVDALPSQTGNSGKFLTTNGSAASWATVSAGTDLPSQTGNSGKFLTTDGTSASWATVDDLPSQTGNSGKFLTTDGMSASWAPTSGGTWGSITGTLSDQADLQAALDDKQDKLNAGNNISIEEVGGGWSPYSEISYMSYYSDSSTYDIPLAYGNGKFVTISMDNRFSTSTDGLTWSTPESSDELSYAGSSGYWSALAYGNGKFVAISLNKDHDTYISTSTDGVTWTEAIPSEGLNYESSSGYLRTIAYGNGKFVTISSWGYTSTSVDGTTWSNLETDYNLGDHSWGSITYDGTKFIAMGSGYDSVLDEYSTYISTSTDGETWAEATKIGNLTCSFDIYWKSLTYDGNQLIAIRSDGYTSTSTDGLTWTTPSQILNLGNHNWGRLAYGGSKVVAIGAGSYDNQDYNYVSVLNPPTLEISVTGIRTVVESGRNGIDYWEIYSDGTLEQGGSCTAGTPIVFTKAFNGTDYVLPVPYSAKTATGFTPSATGDWIAKGMKASS